MTVPKMTMDNAQTIPDAAFTTPVHLNDQTQDTLLTWTNAKGVDSNTFVNDLLKKSIALIEVARWQAASD